MTRIVAAVSTRSEAAMAGEEAAAAAARQLSGLGADLACVFLTPDHLGASAEAVAGVRRGLRPRHLIGCVSQGVVGGEHELEAGPAVSVWAASLPGADLDVFHLDDAESLDEEPPGLASAEFVLLLVCPFTFQAGSFLERIEHERPGLPVVGGIAVGAGRAGAQELLVDRDIHDGGAVGVAVRGAPVEVVVSQGCAPLGREATITNAESNVVFELAGQPALARLRETIGGLTPRERELARQGLLAGLVIDENKPEYGRGDFLMRAILGADESSGAIAIGERVRVGQTLRFHARDADSAHEDLSLALDEALRRAPARPAGALLFTCNGRGATLFGAPDHDSATLVDALGTAGVAGFFCGGEIGPVGGRNFLHGFTATMAVFLECGA